MNCGHDGGILSGTTVTMFFGKALELVECEGKEKRVSDEDTVEESG